MGYGRPDFHESTMSPLAVLMQEPPGGTKFTDWEFGERLRQAVDLEMERLDDEDAWILYMLFYADLSLRFVALVLGVPKTSMARRRDEILTRLRKAMVEYPVVQDMLSDTPKPSVIPMGMESLGAVRNWEEGAAWSYQALTHLRCPTQFTIESLLAEARQTHPNTPTLGWWADLLDAAWRESNGAVDRDTLLKLLSDKQHDYGYDNILSFGHAGIVIRCSDKAARLVNLKRRAETPSAEPLVDTYYDLCGYAVIAGMLEWGLFMLPQKDR
jgi:hypothetical protein